MALRWADGFTHYPSADLGTVYDSQSGATLSNGNGRFGNDSLRFTANSHYVEKILDAQATWIFTFGLRVSSIGTAVTLLQLKDGISQQVDLRITSGGALQVTRNGTSLGTGGTIAANTYYSIELKITIDNSSGVAIVKQDGTTVINLSSQDTQNTGNATADRFRVLCDASLTVDISDLIVCDASGSVNNDFIGDRRIITLYPNGAGASAQFTASAGSNYQCVDEAEANGDTDYVESSNVTDRDSYAFSNLSSTSGAINGVVLVAQARKTDAGSREIQLSTRIGSTYYDSGNKVLSSSYGYHQHIWENSPATTDPWTGAEVNAAEFGIELVV